MTNDVKKDYLQKMYKIIGLCMEIYNDRGRGLAEPIYQECLEYMCQDSNVPYTREKILHMEFRGHPLKVVYKPDFIIWDIIVECKSVESLKPEHRAQLFNYMRITKNPCGLLVNFSSKGHLHTERYFYNEETDEIEFVNSKCEHKSEFYPGSNYRWEELN